MSTIISLRKRAWEIVELAKPGDTASRIFDISILSLIFLNVLAVIFGTIKEIQIRYGAFLEYFEIISVAVFTLEYFIRIWSCISSTQFSHPLKGRLHFAIQPMPLIDLLAILPFYLPFLGFDLRFIRVLRLFRIFRIAKVGRYYSSLQLIKDVFISKKEELILTTVVMILLLIISASLIFYCENSAQPEKFPDIPSSMWWAVVTLTTVGYGDIRPVTTIGKFFASIIAILGIGMFALPTGILGAGFIQEVSKRKEKKQICPHCGKEI